MTELETSEATEAEPTPERASLKKRTILGAIWQSAGYGVGHVLRLAANLGLSRILFPEAYGIMAAVSAFVAGLQMLSDLGVDQAVVRSKRGDDPDFLNTAWTVNIIRGGLLYVAAVALTWPMASFYGEPLLRYIFPVSGTIVLLNAFRSPAMITAKRHLKIRKLVIVEQVSYIVSVVVMVVLALITRSVWALVAGGIASALTYLTLTYVYLRGPRPKLRLDPSAWREIYDFGKWIFLSTSLTFVANHGDRMLLGHLMGMLWLGLYGIARNLAAFFEMYVVQLGAAVLYPAFSEVARESRERLREVYYRTRLKLDLLLLPGIGALVVLGGAIVRFLLDDRYHPAGWMFQYMMLRGAIATLQAPCQAGLAALGLTRAIFLRSLARALWMATVIPIGWFYLWPQFHVAKLQGLCLAVATAELPGLVLMWVEFRHQGLLDLRREALAGVLFGAGIGAGLLLLQGLVAIGAM